MQPRKTLLAAAVLAMMTGTAAYAETSVTLYGLIDLGLTYQRGKVGTEDANRPLYGGDYRSHIGMGSGLQSGSRWGLRGVEDLGDGWNVNFVLESGFAANDGTRDQDGRLFGRQATIGVSNASFGSLDLGRRTNLASDYFGDIDPFGTDFSTASMGSAFSAANTVRYDNMIMYQTPNFGGFQAGVGYAFSFDTVNGPNNFEDDENNRAITAGLKYGNGPLTVALTYDHQFLYPSQPQPKQLILGGAYDFEVVKLALAYGRTEDGVIWGQDYALGAGTTFDYGLAPNDPPSRGDGYTADRFSWDGLKINSYMVGLSAPIGGASKAYVSWQRADPNKGLETMDVYSLGATYDLSKRTNLYAFGSYADAYSFIEGNKMYTVGMGIRHRF